MSKPAPTAATPDDACLGCGATESDETWAVRQTGDDPQPFCSEQCARDWGADPDAVYQVFWILSNRHGSIARTLHSDRTCRKLRNSEDVRPATRAAHPDKRVCKDCRGVDYFHDGGDQGIHEALRDPNVTSFEDARAALGGDE